MRAALGALLALAGCAAPEPGRPAAAERRWQAVCERMRCASDDDRTPTAASVSPAADEVAALRRSAARAAASVVRISTRIEQAPSGDDAPGPLRVAARPSGGTGVVIDASGLILTCAHVVDHARDIRVHLLDANGAAAVDASLVACDAEHDLAVLRIRRTGLAPLAISPQLPNRTAAVVALGALADPADARPGRITSLGASLQSALGRTGGADYTSLIETTVALEPGFSGGPLLDADGRLVGINVAMRGGAGGTQRGYAVGLDAERCAAIARMCGHASR